MLGFASACDDEKPESEKPVEYGSPHATFSVKGKVVDAPTGLGVDAILLTLKTTVAGSSQELELAKSNLQGEFNISGSTYYIGIDSPEEMELLLEAQDIDGTANNSYLKKKMSVSLKRDPGVSSESWFKGHYKAEDVVIALESADAPARYSVSGRVVNPDGEPVCGIRVAYNDFHSTLTDREGAFKLEHIEIDGDVQSILLLVFEDVDGEENGGWFSRQDVEVAFKPDPDNERILTAEDVLVMLDEATLAEYGVPYVTFSAKGKVTNPDGEPVEGIEVSIREEARTYTDAEGNYRIEEQPVWLVSPEREEISISFRDVDGAENGLLSNQDVVTQFERVTEDGTDGNWHDGHYKAADDVDVTLDWYTRSKQEQ